MEVNGFHQIWEGWGHFSSILSLVSCDFHDTNVSTFSDICRSLRLCLFFFVCLSASQTYNLCSSSLIQSSASSNVLCAPQKFFFSFHNFQLQNFYLAIHYYFCIFSN
jgi:hypothetical protein